MSVPTTSSSSGVTASEAIRQLELALHEAIPPFIQQSRTAFRRELPTLLQSHAGQWVAFHGENKFGPARNKTELVQQCLRSGLQRSEFLVVRIEPEIEQRITVPLDV